MVKEKKEDTAKVDPIHAIVRNSIEENKGLVYSGKKKINYKVSTGSYRLDNDLGGGIGKGLTRLCGYTTAGKTSELFLLVANAFKQFKRCRCLYVPAEGRDNIGIMDRVGLKYTEEISEWNNHSVFAFVTNAYEPVADLAYAIVKANELRKEDEQEIFILAIDSLDCLIPQDDLAKGAKDAFKVAGAQLLSKKLWQRLAVPFNSGGHMALITSMQSATIKIDPYAKVQKRTTSGAGGTAMNHVANTILEFYHRTQADYILEDPKEKYDPVDNPKIGHDVTVWIIKSSNEKYDHLVKYPIKYGMDGEGSIWVSREIVEMSLDRDLFTKKGNTFEPSETLAQAAKQLGVELKEKIVGINSLYKYIEDNTKVADVLRGVLDVLISAEKIARFNKTEEETDID